MYTVAIFFGITGSIFLGINIYLFLKDYSLVISKKYSMKDLTLNISGLASSIAVIVFALIYFVMLDSQL